MVRVTSDRSSIVRVRALGILLPSLIVLKAQAADLEGPSSLRDLLLDRSKLPIPNMNNARTIIRINTNQKLKKITSWSQSLSVVIILHVRNSYLSRRLNIRNMR